MYIYICVYIYIYIYIKEASHAEEAKQLLEWDASERLASAREATRRRIPRSRIPRRTSHFSYKGQHLESTLTSGSLLFCYRVIFRELFWLRG